MDRIWQWAWDRHGPRYSWAIYAGTVVVLMPIYLVLSLVVVAFERSGQHGETVVVTVVAVLVLAYVMILPGLGGSSFFERWAAGHEVDRARALDATYVWARGAVARAVGVTAVWAALLLVVVGVIAGASTGVGDSLPRTSPTFAAWSNLAILATAFTFAVTGAMLAAVFDRAASVPVLAVVIGCGLTLGFAAPLTVGTGVRTVAATDSRPRRRN